MTDFTIEWNLVCLCKCFSLVPFSRPKHFSVSSTGGAGQPDVGRRQHCVGGASGHHETRLLSRPHHLPHPQTPQDEQVRVRHHAAGPPPVSFLCATVAKRLSWLVACQRDWRLSAGHGGQHQEQAPHTHHLHGNDRSQGPGGVCRQHQGESQSHCSVFVPVVCEIIISLLLLPLIMDLNGIVLCTSAAAKSKSNNKIWQGKTTSFSASGR